MYKFCCLLFILLLACSQQKGNGNQDVLAIDFDITQESGLGPDDMECVFIPLETKEECLLSLSFEDVQFFDDRIFIINYHANKAKVFVFDHEGRFIAQIGGIGKGPGEYQQPYNLHINKNKNIITVADRHLRKLVNYDLGSYQYVSSESVPFNFANCAWLSDELIVWCNEGGIDTGNRKWHYACIADENMEIVSTWHETSPSGYGIGNISLYKHGNHTYTGLPFSPFIHRIDAESVTPVMELSFGKQKLPPKSLVVDEKEDSMAWLRKVLASEYINSFRAYETSDYLGVSFYGTTFQRHLGFYDKRNHKTYAFAARDFMNCFHLYGVYEIINTYNDYFVARIEPRMLKKYIPLREDLRLIAENMTEEDNPVLCLFKLK